MVSVTVRMVGPEEEEGPLRDIRLRALVDAPLAFTSTTAAVAAASEGGETDIRRVLIAESAGAWVGVVEVVVPSSAGTRSRIEGLWVDPGWRRRGIGTTLVESACEHVRTAGAAEVMLWVGVDNRAALRLYRRLGFAATGHTRPVPSDHSSTEQAMARDLRRGAVGRRRRGRTVR